MTSQSSCDDPVPVVASLRDEAPEIKTFVVGFGEADDAQSLVDAFEFGQVMDLQIIFGCPGVG